MLGAIMFAHEEIKKHCAVQIELMKELGKDVKREYCHETNDEELRQTIISELYDKAYAIATSGTMKHERAEAFDALEAEFASRYTEEELEEKAPLIHKYFHDDVQKKAMRNMILDEGKRLVVVVPTRFVLSGARLATSLALTVRLSSPVARLSRSRL